MFKYVQASDSKEFSEEIRTMVDNILYPYIIHNLVLGR